LPKSNQGQESDGQEFQNWWLLEKAQEAGFDVLFTVDSNISFQQKLIAALLSYTALWLSLS